MKISFARSIALAVGLTCGTSLEAQAQHVGYGSPSLLPLPSNQQDYSVQPVAAFKRFQAEEVGPTVGSPSGDSLVSAPEQLPAQLPPPPLPNSGPVSPFEAAMGGAWGDGSQPSGCADGSCNDGSCVADACCAPCSSWWTSGAFLWMGRSKEDSHQLSFDTGNPLGSVLTTDSANMNFSPGFQISLGR
ncbi:MAG TPA: hypothetical protein VL096_21145, partial [Pirellulaceae bacterium]|nr:hypothetical protein [Pirellulaceae bacterium]